METLSLELDPPIAGGATADIHAWHDGRVLKLYRTSIPPRVGAREARITRALHDAGVRVPRVGELVEVNGRVGLPMEKLSGQPLSLQLADAESGARAGSIAAEVHVEKHALTAQSLTALPVQFRRMIEAGTLSAERKQRVLRAMKSLPDGDRICHGDFHAGNIMMTDGGPIVIDCVVAHRGNPRADEAQTCVAMTEWLHLRMSERSREAVARFIEAYERRYFELSPEGQDEVAMWKPIVAAVRYSVPHPPSSEALLLGMIDGHR